MPAGDPAFHERFESPGPSEDLCHLRGRSDSSVVMADHEKPLRAEDGAQVVVTGCKLRSEFARGRGPWTVVGTGPMIAVWQQVFIH